MAHLVIINKDLSSHLSSLLIVCNRNSMTIITFVLICVIIAERNPS